MKKRDPRRPGEPLAKMPTGLAGFDSVSDGGLPRGRTTLITGGPGCGKTIFALQTLVNGARDGNEAGIFVAFEEPARQIVDNCATFGWDLPALQKKHLFFFDARLSPSVVQGGDFDLSGLLGMLENKAKAMGARRIVFDGLDVLLTLLNDPLAERRELYRLHEWLQTTGLTGILTGKADNDDQPVPARYSFIQFMVDCVLALQHHYVDHVSLRSGRIVKYRGSSFLANEFPFVIGPAGIEIPDMSDGEGDYTIYDERVTTGVERLDVMLDGGYLRGTSILITGAPGTAKSTLGGAFVEAACRRGERALYVSFDEDGREVVRNLASVGIRLAPHVKSGRLTMHSARSEVRSADKHLLALAGLIAQSKPSCVVVDPLSAMIKAGGLISGVNMAQRLVRLTKAAGITLISTSLLQGDNPEAEGTAVDVSATADTWIHLSYVVRGGERNRALTIIKSRGTAHSNQVRELILNSHGPTLTDAYTAGGEVLLGTARWEKQVQVQVEADRLDAQTERQRQAIEIASQEIHGRIASLQRELQLKQDELAQNSEVQRVRVRQTASKQRGLTQLRRGHSDAGQTAKTNGQAPGAAPRKPRPAAKTKTRNGGQS
ncbi:MAG: circadian clock protein KaiC [Anaerolineales bacterium]